MIGIVQTASSVTTVDMGYTMKDAGADCREKPSEICNRRQPHGDASTFTGKKTTRSVWGLEPRAMN